LSFNAFLTPNNNFSLFSLEHGLAILLFTFLGIIIIRWAINQNKDIQDKLGIGITWILVLTNIIWVGLQVYVDDFNYREDLPLHLCNVVGIFTLFLAMTKKFWIYEVLFFWVMSAVVLAIVTPGIVDSFPHYHFLKYWITHAGVIIFMLYATFVYKMQPKTCSILKSFLAIQIYAIIIYAVNNLLGSNYFYLNKKPPVETLLDAFGDWPNYIIAIQLILLPWFILIYSPFYLFDRIKNKRLN